MTPSFAPMNTAHLHLLNAKLARDSFLRDTFCAQFSNPENVHLGKLGQGMASATVVRSMRKLISHVLRYSSPRDMLGRATSLVTFPAKVSCLVRERRAWAVDHFAYDGRDNRHFAFVSNVAIPVTGDRIRPLQAFRRGVLENNVLQKCKRFAVTRLLAAFFSGGYTGFSHSGLLTRSVWLERAAMFQHPARSLFVRALRVSVQ